ncbi:arabinogalactan endo-1,4-beta-galactosidase [Saccharothrix longispora]|uniref:Arabinogalactan endo-beta-1,4-galactanase n=1 Tax=Saccharothrix longispora TaxID=33920 RepID=A0ABU1PVZ0_9PSEU|nr:arabinogalactan endo-1,4-beta-galactosidase [Saccharothrix longispora]MDR6594813.1 arabinogalactan endo-1,4-beta-galactosidase [Saccharothrix longispora]
MSAFPTLLTAAVLAAAALAPPPQAVAASTLANPGFESGASGWTSTGGASFTEAGGRSGSTRLTHWSSSAYRVETRQTLTGLTSGWYTARAWVRSSGWQNTAHLALRDCGGAEQRVALPVSADGLWTRVAVSAQVSGGRCTVALVSDAKAGNWINVDDLEFVGGRAAVPVRGGDTSTLPKSEANGGVYRTASGQAQDALQVLGTNGMNLVRLKVWVNPADGYNDKARVLAMAKRVKDRGMQLMIDFHYSDAWADPGRQRKPAAWAGYSFAQLTKAVHDHTYDVLNALKAQGTTADYTQVGNEINPGMLLPDGSSDNWANLSALLKSGVAAVRAVSSSTKVMLHLANGADQGTVRWWFDNAVSRGVPFDVVGLSYYGYWHGTLGALQRTLFDVSARYGKDVMVVETAYPFTMADADSEPNAFSDSSKLLPGYPATSEGQLAHFRDVISVVQAVPRALGVVYWEPTWYAVPGNGWDPYDPDSGDGWDNQALFDWSGRALPAITAFNR